MGPRGDADDVEEGGHQAVHVDGMSRALGRKGPTKAQREEQKAASLEKELQKRIADLQAKGLLPVHNKEVKLAA